MATRADVLRLKIDVDEQKASGDIKKFQHQVEQSNRQITTSNQKSAKSFDELRLSMTKIAGGIAVITAAIYTVDRLAKQAERVSALGEAFGTLGNRIDATSKFLPKLREATRGYVTDAELMKQANNAIILGVAQSEDQFAKLAAGAVTLGRAVGLEATPAIESLVTGIGRQSRLMLDNLGLIVKVEEANRKYADSIGKAVGELTDEQKKLAFATEAIRAMEEALVGLNSETVLLSDYWNRAKSAVKNAVDSMLDDINRVPETGWYGVLALLGGGGAPGASFAARALAARAAHRAAPGRQSQQLRGEMLRSLGMLPGGAYGQPSQGALAQPAALPPGPVPEGYAPGRYAVQQQYLPVEPAAFNPPDMGVLMPTDVAPPPRATDLGEPAEAVQSLTSLIDTEMRNTAVNGVQFLGRTLADMFMGAQLDASQFFKSLLSMFTQAIAQALALKAAMALFPGAGGAGAGLNPLNIIEGGFGVFEKGGIVGVPGARRGMMVRGGIPGRDSVPIVAQRGEAVLPKPLTDFLMAAVRNPHQGTREGQDAGCRNASRSAASMNVHIHATDASSFEDMLEADPERILGPLRRAWERGY